MILGNNDNRHIRRCHRPEDHSINLFLSFRTALFISIMIMIALFISMMMMMMIIIMMKMMMMWCK